MTARSPLRAIILLFLSLLLAIHAEIHAEVERSLSGKPETVVLERLNDAHHVLLIQTSNNGTFAQKLGVPCGMDNYYTTSAVVLRVDTTIDPDSTILGVPNTGRVMEMCDKLDFSTNVIDLVEGCIEDEPSDPGGRKEEGWCGKVYLMPGVEADVDPYVLASGARSFEEVDKSVCEDLMKICVDKVGSGSSGGDGGGDNGGGGEDGTKSSAVGTLPLGSSVMIALLSVVGLWAV